jgi:hypothetical protein
MLDRYLTEPPTITEKLMGCPKDTRLTVSGTVSRKRGEAIKYIEAWEASWTRASA